VEAYDTYCEVCDQITKSSEEDIWRCAKCQKLRIPICRKPTEPTMTVPQAFHRTIVVRLVEERNFFRAQVAELKEQLKKYRNKETKKGKKINGNAQVSS
jgi:hypothetical protein